MVLKEIQELCRNSSALRHPKYMQGKAQSFGGNFSTQKRISYFDCSDVRSEIPCGFFKEFPIRNSGEFLVEILGNLVYPPFSFSFSWYLCQISSDIIPYSIIYSGIIVNLGHGRLEITLICSWKLGSLISLIFLCNLTCFFKLNVTCLWWLISKNKASSRYYIQSLIVFSCLSLSFKPDPIDLI